MNGKLLLNVIYLSNIFITKTVSNKSTSNYI